MKGFSARTYCTNYSTTDSEKMVHLLTTKASEQMSTSTGALQTTYPRLKQNWQTDF